MKPIHEQTLEYWIKRAQLALGTGQKPSLKSPVRRINHIARATDFYAHSSYIQGIVSKHLKIPK